MWQVVGNQVRKTGWPLYLHGPPGHGKTCFAALVYASSAGYGPNGSMWYTCRKLLGQLAMSRSNPDAVVEEFCRDGSFQSVDYWTAWNRLRTVGLVVIDDLGASPLTEVQSGLLCEILDVRQSLKTIITGNLDRRKLSEFSDPRLVGRLCSGTDFSWSLVDRRVHGEFGVRPREGNLG